MDMTPDQISAAQVARHLRTKLLNEHVDGITAVRWHVMDDAQKTAVLNYRQALLDVPQQPGFPENIQWPAKPE